MKEDFEQLIEETVDLLMKAESIAEKERISIVFNMKVIDLAGRMLRGCMPFEEIPMKAFSANKDAIIF